VSLPVHNHLLAALPAGEFDHFASHLEPVTMAAGEVLCESGGQLKYVYLPTTAIVSLLYVLEDGATEEIGMVGN
jgi:CRP-like cAMP-binding protein